MITSRTPSRLETIVERRSSLEESPQAPRTILIVDDEQGILRCVERILRNAGYATVVAANAPAVTRIAASLPSIDLLVTDVMMPEMSGCELSRRLRRSNPDLKVLYVTGYRDRLFNEKVMMWENEAFVEKPSSGKALLEAVSLLWSRRVESPVVPETFVSSGRLPCAGDVATAVEIDAT